LADEEALSTTAPKWLCANAADDIRTDYVITESGGFPMNGATGSPGSRSSSGEGRLLVRAHREGNSGPCVTAAAHRQCPVKRPRSSAASTSTGPGRKLHEAWTRFITGLGFPPEFTEPLLDPDRIDAFCEELPLLGLARQAHACTHTTLAPTIMRRARRPT